MFGIPVTWIVAGLLALGVGVGGWTAVRAYNSAIEARVTAEKQRDDAQEATTVATAQIEKLQEMGRMADALATKSKQEADRERKRAGEFEERLRSGAANDPKARDWLATPVPALVRGMRRAERALPPGGAVLSADSPPQPDPRPSPAR